MINSIQQLNGRVVNTLLIFEEKTSKSAGKKSTQKQVDYCAKNIISLEKYNLEITILYKLKYAVTSLSHNHVQNKQRAIAKNNRRPIFDLKITSKNVKKGLIFV